MQFFPSLYKWPLFHSVFLYHNIWVLFHADFPFPSYFAFVLCRFSLHIRLLFYAVFPFRHIWFLFHDVFPFPLYLAFVLCQLISLFAGLSISQYMSFAISLLFNQSVYLSIF